ncbi:MAG: hypothetical protein PHP98_00670 [Kiritimatiellae bacterium]|nr:hypothetical protein [Kiritimatiellia bacterium]
MKGYDLGKYLHALLFDIGRKTAKIRYDFHDILSRLYADSFFKTIHEWGSAHKLMLTGHVMGEDCFSNSVPHAGHLLRPLSFFHIPGVDFVHGARRRWVDKLNGKNWHTIKEKLLATLAAGVIES